MGISLQNLIIFKIINIILDNNNRLRIGEISKEMEEDNPGQDNRVESAVGDNHESLYFKKIFPHRSFHLEVK